MQAFDFREIQELTNLCFQSDHYIQNFPQVFKKENFRNFFFLQDKNKLVSFCTLHSTSFLQNNKILNGYCMGSVCTHPDYRGKGLARQVLAMAESKVQLAQGHFIYLFSNENQFYENLGYQFCGETFISELNPNSKFSVFHKKLMGKYFNYKILKLLPSEMPNEILIAQLWRFILQNSKSCESFLSYLEFKDILQIKNMQMYYLLHKEKICSVCFLNKGDDFENVIHGLYYSHPDYAILLSAETISKISKPKKFYFFPGPFFSEFAELFDYQVLPSMYVKIISHSKDMDLSSVFVRSLQGA